MTRRTLLGRTAFCAVLVALTVIGVIALTMFRDGASRSVPFGDGVRPSPAPIKSIADPKPDLESVVGSSPPLAGLTPADVLGNPDCIMRPGAGRGRDLAMVVVPGEDGSRFAVVDGSGTVFSDTLPFPAVRDSSLVRREDGAVLVGFGGSDAPLRRDFRLRRALPPSRFVVRGVVVYQDGQVIYESPTGRRFDLADDGSSFYVMEPMAGDVSRLVIRNLDLGEEVHHDRGNLQTANDGFARYSVDQSQVIFQPSGLFFSGDRSVEMGFFPTDGSEPRQLLMNLEAPGLAKFVSSNEGYFGLWRGDDLATVKREFLYDGTEVSVEERWSRDLSISQISSDGAWLVGHGGTGVHVLDASTGNTVFEHAWSSVDTSIRIHDGRLVLGHGVGDADDIARCRAKREVVSRTPEDDADGTGTIRSVVYVSGEKACLADLQARGLYRTVYDVYDLRTLADGTSPDHYQVEYGENSHCGSGDDPFGTLEVRDDQLVYVPRTSTGPKLR